MLTNDLHVILNSAASIKYDDPLDKAIQINYLGAVRILELAHDCPNFIALHHVSTVGVQQNLPRDSWAKEIIPPCALGEDNF